MISNNKISILIRFYDEEKLYHSMPSSRFESLPAEVGYTNYTLYVISRLLAEKPTYLVIEFDNDVSLLLTLINQFFVPLRSTLSVVVVSKRTLRGSCSASISIDVRFQLSLISKFSCLFSNFLHGSGSGQSQTFYIRSPILSDPIGPS